MLGRRLFKRIIERKVLPRTCESPMSSQERSSPYKRWYELNLAEKQYFVHQFVNNYKRQYPGSKTNVSLKGLATGMDDHNDSPSVFGIFYNDIWRRVAAPKPSPPARDRPEAVPAKGSRFDHTSFHCLLIRK